MTERISSKGQRHGYISFCQCSRHTCTYVLGPTSSSEINRGLGHKERGGARRAENHAIIVPAEFAIGNQWICMKLNAKADMHNAGRPAEETRPMVGPDWRSESRQGVPNNGVGSSSDWRLRPWRPHTPGGGGQL